MECDTVPVNQVYFYFYTCFYNEESVDRVCSRSALFVCNY